MSTTHDDMHDTQAAEPVLDATAPAPAEDETQSIYAWSQYDNDGDTIAFQRRSWKLPIAAALIAAAGLTAGAITMWPHHSTPQNPTVIAAPPAQIQPAPSAAPVQPPAPPSPDVLFINTLNDGIKDMPDMRPTPQGDPDAILMGHDVCTKLGALYQTDRSTAYGDLTHQMQVATGMPEKVVASIMRASELAYCPQYGS